MSLIHNAIRSGELIAEMTWDTWWALVLGFTLSGAVEAFVSDETMSDVLGGDGWREVGLGAAFGAASSSCSYSAVGTTKTLFTKGASGVASLGAFMFASTDLVIELGLVIWVLLGWQFVVGEYLGGLVAVLVLGLLFKHAVPAAWLEDARDHARTSDETVCATCEVSVDPADQETVTAETTGGRVYFCCGGCQRVYEAREVDDGTPDAPLRERLLSAAAWRSASRAAMKDWEMLWTDIALGFLVAGLVGGFVPATWWAALFSGGGSFSAVLAATLIAIAIGVLTFMCSVGNVPFALVLWRNGLPYGAVLSFIYADLLIPPLVNIYRKYYGLRMAATLFVALALAAAIAGVTIHYVAGGLGIVPPSGAVGGTVPDTYTVALNLAFTPIFLAQVIATHGWAAIRDRTLAAVHRSVAAGRRAVRAAGRSAELATGATAAVVANPSALRAAVAAERGTTAEISAPAAKVKLAAYLLRAALVESVGGLARTLYRIAVRLDASRSGSGPGRDDPVAATQRDEPSDADGPD